MQASTGNDRDIVFIGIACAITCDIIVETLSMSALRHLSVAEDFVCHLYRAPIVFIAPVQNFTKFILEYLCNPTWSWVGQKKKNNT